MNRGAQPRQGLAAGRGQAQQPQQQQPQGQNHQQQQQQPQDQYGQDQYDQDPSQPRDYSQDVHDPNQPHEAEHYDHPDMEDDEQQNGNYGQEGDEQQPEEEGDMQADADPAYTGEEHAGGETATPEKPKDNKAGKAGPVAKKGTANDQLAKKKSTHAAKPQHAHSRFAQDGHHHNMMGVFHNIASEGLTHAHMESFVHLGSFALAHLAKQTGMTAGHEPEEEEKASK